MRHRPKWHISLFGRQVCFICSLFFFIPLTSTIIIYRFYLMMTRATQWWGIDSLHHDRLQHPEPLLWATAHGVEMGSNGDSEGKWARVNNQEWRGGQEWETGMQHQSLLWEIIHFLWFLQGMFFLSIISYFHSLPHFVWGSWRLVTGAPPVLFKYKQSLCSLGVVYKVY